MRAYQGLEFLQYRDACIAIFAYLEDVIGGQHFQDQVPIVGDYHKLVQGWPAQNGIKGEIDLCDIKEDTLCVNVLRHPECDQEGDTTA
jgi:hypothetical protein